MGERDDRYEWSLSPRHCRVNRGLLYVYIYIYECIDVHYAICGVKYNTDVYCPCNNIMSQIGSFLFVLFHNIIYNCIHHAHRLNSATCHYSHILPRDVLENRVHQKKTSCGTKYKN